jgi:Zinc knuckle
MRENMARDKNPVRKYYFPQREKDLNAMDVDRLSINEQTRLMKEGRCFKCKNTGHRANKCPDDENDKRKVKEEPRKKMVKGKEVYTHIQSIFKELYKKEKEEFMKDAEEAGF